MRHLNILPLVFLFACAPAPQQPPEAAPKPPPQEGTAEKLGRCHPSCCTDEVRELQAKTARETGDPSIANECCFCESQGTTPRDPAEASPCKRPVAEPSMADANMPQGRLGYPLGSYLVIEGVIGGARSKAVPDILVDTVNGKRLPEPLGVGTQGLTNDVRSRLGGKRATLRGYESGRWIGVPDAVAEAEGMVPSQAQWQFYKYFVITRIDGT
ncbi:hypothetical protein ACFL6C_10770 [Myxococcota bacterium]